MDCRSELAEDRHAGRAGNSDLYIQTFDLFTVALFSVHEMSIHDLESTWSITQLHRDYQINDVEEPLSTFNRSSFRTQPSHGTGSILLASASGKSKIQLFLIRRTFVVLLASPTHRRSFSSKMATAPSTPAPVLPSVDPQTPPGVLVALQSLRQASTSKSPASVASAPDSREPSSSLSPPAQDGQDEAAGTEPGQGEVKEENANNEEVNGATPGKKEKKPRNPRKKKVVEPIVYEIPDVERLETTFK